MTGRFRIELLQPTHDRSGFVCGVAALERYFREQVSQDVRRRTTVCYVAFEIDTGALAGFYTLAAASVPLQDIPVKLSKNLPRYPSVPVARLGRLAVASDQQGRKLGAALLWDAALRAQRSEIAVFALVVDAKDDAAEDFYKHHGFLPFENLPRQLVLPLATLVQVGS